MKNFFLTLGALLAVGALSFATFFAANAQPAIHHAAREGDAMAWLRTEFQLSDAQFVAIKQLHDDYGRVCAEHCAAVMAAKARSAPPQEMAALEAICVDAMTQHFRRVAGLMPPGQGERYLATVLPKVAGYDHAEAPTVQVRP
jgi:hypothetical protein